MQICLIYLDDIIVFGKDFEEHMGRLDIILNRISKAGWNLKPEKYDLLKTEVLFFAIYLKINLILIIFIKFLTWPTATSVTELT